MTGRPFTSRWLAKTRRQCSFLSSGGSKWTRRTRWDSLRCTQNPYVTFTCVKNPTHSVCCAPFVQFGVAPIHLAAWFGSLNILKLLVQAGAEQKVESEVRMQEVITIMTLKLGNLSSWATTTQKYFIQRHSLVALLIQPVLTLSYKSIIDLICDLFLSTAGWTEHFALRCFKQPHWHCRVHCERPTDERAGQRR